MLYFSAHWCPPCRGFTPELAVWYEKHRPQGAEIVFVSSDRDQGSFDEYFGEMPWVALEYPARDLKASLSRAFGVKGIPMLIVCDAAGVVISKNGREGVSSKPHGFPWAPAFSDTATPQEVLTAAFPSLLKASGEVATASLAGKHLMVYSSAHWCGPCRNFTPLLKRCYEALTARGVAVEVVFLSADNNEEEFQGYFKDMSWAAAPYGAEKFDAAKSWFDAKFEIEGIPNLLLFAPDGTLLEADATGKVRGDPEGAKFPWPREPVETVESTMGKINDGPVVLAFVGDGGDANAAKALLEPAAKAFFGAPGAPLFAVGKGGDKSEGAIMRFCGFGKPEGGGVKFVIVDVPAKKKAFLGGGDGVATPTSAEVEAWVRAYINGTASTKGIKE